VKSIQETCKFLIVYKCNIISGSVGQFLYFLFLISPFVDVN